MNNISYSNYQPIGMIRLASFYPYIGNYLNSNSKEFKDILNKHNYICGLEIVEYENSKLQSLINFCNTGKFLTKEAN